MNIYPLKIPKNGLALAASLAFLCFTTNLPSQTLAYEEFMQMVKGNHPASRQAAIVNFQAKAALKSAKGAFDPKVYADHLGKQFKGKTYFQYSEAGVKWPTGMGLELKSAYNQHSGVYLNPEQQLPENGQLNLGFTWSVGQGLLMDERRAGLRLAGYGLSAAEAEKRMRLNDLLLEAAKTYWEWHYALNARAIIESALNQARLRHEGIRTSFLNGERSANDTLESFIQVQSRLVDLQFAEVEAQNADIALGAFFWGENQTPALPGKLTPPPMSDVPATVTPDTSRMYAHPALQLSRIKLKQLEVERKLKAEKRKPVIDLQYYLLGNGWEFFPGSKGVQPAMFANDVKWGIDFSYPILNRKAQGEIEMTRLKIAQTRLELQQKERQVAVKVNQYANDLQNLSRQAQLFGSLTEQYRRLLDGENDRLALGESSLFLVNTREQRWLEAQLKYLKLWAEYQKCSAGLAWARGTLAE